MQQFEDYVKKYLFPENCYDLLHQTHSYQANKERYIKSSLEPDFKFKDRYNKQEFYVEVKFRAVEYKNKFVWCNDKQLSRYQSINKFTPVFLLLGDGGSPQWPDHISLIPLSKAKYTGLFPSFVDQFAIEPEQPVTSKILWSK